MGEELRLQRSFVWVLLEFCGQQGFQGMRKMSMCLLGLSYDAPLSGWGWKVKLMRLLLCRTDTYLGARHFTRVPGTSQGVDGPPGCLWVGEKGC